MPVVRPPEKPRRLGELAGVPISVIIRFISLANQRRRKKTLGFLR